MAKTRSAIFMGLALIAGIGLVNCSKNNSSSPPSNTQQTGQATPTPSPTPAVSWTSVREQTQCEAMNPAACLGAYGFSVFADGSYSAGPSASGRTVSGKVSDQELATLSATVMADVQTSSASSCQTGQHIPGNADKVRVSLSDNSFYDAYSQIGTTGQTCYRGEPAAATTLHDDLHSLMTKYYPSDFQ